MSNSLKINFAHVQYGISTVGPETQLRGRSLSSCLQVSCRGSKAQGLTPQPSEENGIPGKNCSTSPSDPVSPCLFTERLSQTRFCPSIRTSRLRGGPGAHLWQLLHNHSENHQLMGTARLIMPKWSWDGIPRQLSHRHGLDVSLPHISFGFLKEVELFPPLKCVEAHGLNGGEGELTSGTFPLLVNGLCLTLRIIQEQGGIFVTA